MTSIDALRQTLANIFAFNGFFNQGQAPNASTQLFLVVH